MAPLFLLLLSAPERPYEAAFSLDGGFLNVKVSRAGMGVKARIKAYEGMGVLSEGETDDEGDGTVMFMGARKSVLLGLTVAGKECDLIQLKIHGKEIRPAERALTFGSRPCCVAVPREPEEKPSGGNALLLVGAGAACLLLGVAVAVLRGQA